jgi:hypothetical protein
MSQRCGSGLGTRSPHNQAKIVKKRLDLITLLFSSLQISEGGGNGESGDSFADPCQEFKQGFLGVSSGLPLV